MSATPSTMLPLGTEAPDFSLPNTVDDEMVSLSDFADKEALIVVFTSNHCPYAVRTMPGVLQIAKDYNDRGLGVVAISSNDVTVYEEDAPEFMKKLAIKDGYPFPYLYDETQDVAQNYSAACTPDFFLFDKKRKLAYRGQLDESRPGNSIDNDGKYMREALDSVLAGEEVSVSQHPSLGCNIKWIYGNEPEYFG